MTNQMKATFPLSSTVHYYASVYKMVLTFWSPLWMLWTESFKCDYGATEQYFPLAGAVFYAFVSWPEGAILEYQYL